MEGLSNGKGEQVQESKVAVLVSEQNVQPQVTFSLESRPELGRLPARAAHFSFKDLISTPEAYIGLDQRDGHTVSYRPNADILLVEEVGAGCGKSREMTYKQYIAWRKANGLSA